MGECWRLLLDPPVDGATNMARDEALALGCARGDMPPTLRLYSWSPACLSLGRFQPLAAVDPAACASAGIDLVRRPSGGRAILHSAELTYAVIAPADHALLRGGVRAAYRAISQALLAGLRLLGVAATLAPSLRETRAALRSQRPASCFDSASDYEIVLDGRKLVGSAQARIGGAVLQHGSLPLTASTDSLRTLLVAPPPDLGAHMIALDEAAGRAVSATEAADALTEGFRKTWGIDLASGEWKASEQDQAIRLHTEKYESQEWTERGKVRAMLEA